MALTIDRTVAKPTVFGNRKVVFVKITGDSSYATPGYSLTAADVGLKKIDFLSSETGAADAGTTGVVTKYDYTNSKLQYFWGNAGSASVLPEVTDSTNLSTYVTRHLVIGR